MATKIWTAAELETMTPVEQDEVFDSSVTIDLGTIPPEFLDRVRQRAQHYAAGRR